MCMCVRAYKGNPKAFRVMLINGAVRGNYTPIFFLSYFFLLLSSPLTLCVIHTIPHSHVSGLKTFEAQR